MRARLLAGALVAPVLVACAGPREPSGAEMFASFCAGCHGADAQGDGPDAALLARRPPDLTRLADRAGGTFPTAHVLSTIDGYTRARHGPLVMPEFGVMLEDGPVVLYDAGDGVAVPTQARLVALAEYLRRVQR